jgi:hypothetical protein
MSPAEKSELRCVALERAVQTLGQQPGYKGDERVTHVAEKYYRFMAGEDEAGLLEAADRQLSFNRGVLDLVAAAGLTPPEFYRESVAVERRAELILAVLRQHLMPTKTVVHNLVA